MKLSEGLQISISVAMAEASRLRHDYATLEHLLYALTMDEDTAEVLRHAGANVDRLKQRVHEYLENDVEQIAESRYVEPRPSLGFQRTYSLVHERPDGSCERFFLDGEGMPLSVETRFSLVRSTTGPMLSCRDES